MGKGLENRAKALETYRGKGLGMNGAYRGGSLFGNYLPIGRLNSLEAAYSEGMYKLEEYLSSIITCANSYPNPMAKPYLVEPRAKVKISDPYARRKDVKIKCLRCGEELRAFGGCKQCGWSPFQENVKKGILYEQ